MLLAKRRTSRFSHATGWGGYSKPAPGPDIVLVLYGIQLEAEEENEIEIGREEREFVV